ncbi:MAG: hypothetical protein RR272_01780 [Synergistaceae bacterium]
MSRAFIKEDDAETQDAVDNIQFRENKIEWLKIQENKLQRLLEESKMVSLDKQSLFDKWIVDIKEDIERTKRELGY